MNGAVVLFVGSPALHELRGGNSQSFNWAFGVLHQHLLEKQASLVVSDGAAGPGDLAVRAARALDLEWREYHADGWFYAGRANGSVLNASRWRADGLPAGGYHERGWAIVEYLKERGRVRPISVVSAVAPWSTPLESRPAAGLIIQVVHEGFELTESICPENFARRAGHG